MTIHSDQPSPADTRAGHAHRWTSAIVAAATVLVWCAFRAPASPVAHAAVFPAAQEASRSVWDGVYTEEQAKRGGEAYAEACASCHGDALEGGDGPELVGAAFINLRSGSTVADFFDRLSVTMPDDKPGSLSKQQYADIVARILRANEYPAGSTELKPDDDLLKQIGFKDKPAGR